MRINYPKLHSMAHFFNAVTVFKETNIYSSTCILKEGNRKKDIIQIIHFPLFKKKTGNAGK